MKKTCKQDMLAKVFYRTNESVVLTFTSVGCSNLTHKIGTPEVMLRT